MCLVSAIITCIIYANIPKHQKHRSCVIVAKTFLFSLTFLYVMYALTLDEVTVMLQHVIPGIPDF